MSRNFELLQRLGTTFSSYGADVAAVARPLSEREAVFTPHPLAGFKDEDAPIHSLLQSLFLTNAKGPRLVVFTAAEVGDHNPGIVKRAAELLARSTDGRVCMVNLRPERNPLAAAVGINGGAGLREALIEPNPLEHYLVASGEQNLFVLRRGSAESSSVTRDGWVQRFMELRSSFDYVLVDAPPIAQSAESVLAAQLADGVVVVIEANTTRREHAAEICEKLQSSKIKVLGAVLSNRTFPIPKRLYNQL